MNSGTVFLHNWAADFKCCTHSLNVRQDKIKRDVFVPERVPSSLKLRRTGN